MHAYVTTLPLEIHGSQPNMTNIFYSHTKASKLKHYSAMKLYSPGFTENIV